LQLELHYRSYSDAGTPLLAPLTIMGWPIVELWVASSDAEADLFVYLEDYDPKADKARSEC